MLSFPFVRFRRALLAVPLALLSACLATPNLLLEGHTPRGEREAATAAVISEGSVHILHPYLATRLHALESRSPRFQAEMDALRQGDLPVYIGTEKPVRDAERGITVHWRMPENRIGEFSVVRDPRSGAVSALVARVNLEQIAIRHRRWRTQQASPSELRLSPRQLLEEAVDGILIHELWGHLIPVAHRQDHASHCPDPRPGQPDLASCVMQRENELRLELGMAPRTRYKWSRYARP